MAERFPKDTAQQRTYRAFAALLAGDDATIDLAQAALLIASVEYPDLDMAHYMSQLDAFARRVRAILALPDHDILPQLPSETEPFAVLDALNQVLFVEERFQGNLTDYHNPENSFLNKVLDNHTGIPITLSLLYMEVGKRVGIKIDGIGLPYHFMASYRLPDERIYIDPFENGQFLTEQECHTLVRRLIRNKAKFQPRWFEPVTHRQMLTRVLNNLKQTYIDLEEYQRALSTCDMIIMLSPHLTFELRDRGILYLQLKRYSRALHDLTDYLDQAPDAKDRDEILEHIRTIRQIIAMLN
jgi:regulator of sirC expression with transglutaminase-like and TPR domain